jgi:mannitol/fructose-specific phosphotransferase system IIA component (Ntr-type)
MKDGMHSIKTAINGFFSMLHLANDKLKKESNSKVSGVGSPAVDDQAAYDPLTLVEASCVKIDLRGETKEEIIAELVGLLDAEGKLANPDMVLADVLQREWTMSTGMQHGVAFPHAKSEGVKAMCAAVGVKKAGIDFEALDGEPSYLFVLLVSPKKVSGPHIQFLATVGAILKDADTREKIIRADSPENVVKYLHVKGTA